MNITLVHDLSGNIAYSGPLDVIPAVGDVIQFADEGPTYGVIGRAHLLPVDRDGNPRGQQYLTIYIR